VSLPPEVEAKLEDLRRGFIRSLEAEVTRLDLTVEELLAARDTRAADAERARFREITHRLTGSAAMYGLPAIAAWARAVGQACQAGATLELRAAIRELTDLVRAAAAEAAEAP
jgi:HPt (histidine-containing phosphotransfer) domain-containing protein